MQRGFSARVQVRPLATPPQIWLWIHSGIHTTHRVSFAMQNVAMAIGVARVEDGMFESILGRRARAIEDAVIAREVVGEPSLDVVVSRFTELLQANRGAVLDILGVSRTKLSRNRTMSVELLDRAGSILKVHARVAAAIGPDAAPGWFGRPHRQLGGMTPLGMLGMNLGRERLNDLVTALEDGAFL